jgi:diaminobutyrate-2-oxoglutarate transaminase
MIGVRCADPKRAAAVTKRAFQHGLVIERCGPEDEVIKCMMPLTTSYAELDEGVDILARSLNVEFGAIVRRPAIVRSAPDLELLA